MGKRLVLALTLVALCAAPAGAAGRPTDPVPAKTRVSHAESAKTPDATCPPSNLHNPANPRGEKSSNDTEILTSKKLKADETLTMRLCWENGQSPKGLSGINAGDWTLTNPVGTLTGTITTRAWRSTLGSYGTWTSVELQVVSGTDQLSRVEGYLYFWACGNGRRSGLSTSFGNYGDCAH